VHSVCARFPVLLIAMPALKEIPLFQRDVVNEVFRLVSYYLKWNMELNKLFCAWKRTHERGSVWCIRKSLAREGLFFWVECSGVSRSCLHRHGAELLRTCWSEGPFTRSSAVSQRVFLWAALPCLFLSACATLLQEGGREVGKRGKKEEAEQVLWLLRLIHEMGSGK